jgi:toxin HigB-1
MAIQSFEVYSNYELMHNFQILNIGKIITWDFLKGIHQLDFAFVSKALRTICEKEEEAIHEFGLSVTTALKHRLADIDAAISIKDLLVGKPRIFESEIHNQTMVIDLDDGYQMIFCANHPNNPTMETGEIDWGKVSRIKILRIERNYDH